MGYKMKAALIVAANLRSHYQSVNQTSKQKPKTKNIPTQNPLRFNVSNKIDVRAKCVIHIIKTL
jgi:hypothetical protein